VCCCRSTAATSPADRHPLTIAQIALHGSIEETTMSETDKPGYIPPDLSMYGEEHIRRYEATDGEVGYLWNGATCLVLTTTGAKTGTTRKSALICGFDGDDCIVVASQGGAPTHPNWYHNLVANPDVTVQLKGDKFAARARTAQGSERDRLWKVMTDVWPNYDEYTKRTTRVIPVVVLERVKR
jgi:deazaflavin-dependent oxidoreductase (nitroreductase family)